MEELKNAAALDPGAKWKIRVSLAVFDFPGSPEHLTKLLRTKPTRVSRKGEPAPGIPQIQSRQHIWSIEATNDPTVPLDEQVTALLRRLEEVADRLGSLPTPTSVVLTCAVYDYDRAVALCFSKEAIRRMARIGAELDIDYYDMSSLEHH